MEKFDPEVAARVWQRVTKPAEDFPMPPLPPAYTPPSDASLGECIACAVQAAGIYQRLSRQLSGRDGALLRKMAAQKQQQVACLKGLCAIRGGCTIPRMQPVGNRAPQALLRRCYNWETQLLSLCQARREEPSHGHIYSHLARQQQELCVQLLALLGRIT